MIHACKTAVPVLGLAMLVSLGHVGATPPGQTTDRVENAYRALGLKPKDVLAGTVLSSRVLPGSAKQVVCVATYMTGERERATAINVRLGVFDRVGKRLVPRYNRDFGAENGGLVGNGEIELMDLDADGLNEIIISYESYHDPLINQRVAEVILHGDDGFEIAWTGPIEYDATKAARNVSPERRDRFVRELDYANTLRTRGVTLFMNKKMIAIAGERLAESKVVQETFTLRPNPAYR